MHRQKIISTCFLSFIKLNDCDISVRNWSFQVQNHKEIIMYFKLCWHIWVAVLNFSFCLSGLCDPGGPSLGQREGAACSRHCKLLWRWNPCGHNRLWRGKKCAPTRPYCCLFWSCLHVAHYQVPSRSAKRDFCTSYHKERIRLCSDLEKIIDLLVLVIG